MDEDQDGCRRGGGARPMWWSRGDVAQAELAIDAFSGIDGDLLGAALLVEIDLAGGLPLARPLDLPLLWALLALGLS